MTKLFRFEVIIVVDHKNQKGIAQIVLLFLLLIGIGVGVYLVQNYTSFLPKANLSGGVSLALTPSSATHNKGCDFSLDINLNTAAVETNGTDAVIIYDPAAITVVSVTNGTLYPTYPGNSIDSATGKVRITGLASPTQPVTASGRLATLNLRLNSDTAVTSTVIKFDFDPNNPLKTNDSNVVENATIVDRLQSVVDATINVGSGSGCLGTPNPSNATASSTPTPAPTSTPSSAPFLSAVIEQSRGVYRAKVSWKGVSGATKFDKIDLIFTPFENSSRKTLVNWAYTSTCSTKVPGDVPARSEGSCTFNLSSSKGIYQFKYYSNSANSSDISTSSVIKR